MAKTATSFEYIDGRGRKRRVDSIKKVPREYLGTMVVTGGDEAGAKTAAMSAETAAEGGAGSSPDQFQGGEVTPLMIVVLIMLGGWFFTKSFLGKVVLGAFALMVGFFFWFSWFQGAGEAGTKTWKEFDKEMKAREKRPGMGEYFKKEFADLNRQGTR